MKLIKSSYEILPNDSEFGSPIIVKFICDIEIAHELIESTRYCNYSNNKFNDQITFIIPDWAELLDGEYTKKDNVYSVKNEYIHYENIKLEEEEKIFLNNLYDSEIAYMKLLKIGYPQQDARIVLPNALKTEVIIKATKIEWKNILKLLCSNKAHPRMRELMNPLSIHFENIMPELFKDIKYD